MKIIDFFEHWHIVEPKPYGLFHICFILIDIIAAVLLIVFFRNSKEKIMKRIVFIVWITLVILEIGKQILLSYHDETLSYNWGAFPFQFCELTLYVFPILLINKNEKLRNILIAFFSTYVFFAGFAVMINPSTVMTGNIFLCVRQMIEHGIQFALGLYLFAWNRKNYSFRSFLWGIVVFLIAVVIAISINFIVESTTHEYINMFYLSKSYGSEIFILKNVQPYVPWIIYVLLYVISFTTIAFMTYLCEIGIYRLIKKIKRELLKEEKLQN